MYIYYICMQNLLEYIIKIDKEGINWIVTILFCHCSKDKYQFCFHLYCPFFFLSFLRGSKRKDDNIVLLKVADSLFKDYIFALSLCP